MNVTTSIIVWEWQAQPHIWVPYTPRISQHIEGEFRRSMGSGKVDLSGQNTIELTGCEIDFTNMRQINVLTNESMKVRSQQYPSDCPFAKGVYWKWFSGFQWQVYDVLTSNYIEDAFQQQAKRVDLRHSPIRIPNVITFSTMEQVNKKTKFSRKVEREETKEQYPHANYKTINQPAQSVFSKSGNNPMMPSNTAIRPSNNPAASTTSASQPATQIHYPPKPYGSNNMTHTKSNLANHKPTLFNRYPPKPSRMVTTQSFTQSSSTQPSTQAHSPIMPTSFTSTTHTKSNSANHKLTPSNLFLPNPRNMVTTQSVTPRVSTQPSTQAHSHIIPSGSTGSNNTTHTSGSNFNPLFTPLQHSRSFVSPNVNMATQFGSNSAFNPTLTTGPNTMINLNHTSLPMPNISGGLPVRHTPFSSQNSNTNSNPGASVTTTPHQTSSNTSRASRKKSRRKQRADALSPTPKLKRSINGPLAEFARRVKDGKKIDDECAICLESLSTPSDYDLDPNADVLCVSADVLQLRQCKHIFHRICLQRLYESGTSQNGCLRCPTCKTIHGVMKGNQPEGGTMNTSICTNDIPGYPGCGSIVIVYNFTSGTQGPNHPNPGQPYHPNAFPRTCYLPNNPKGQKVLKLLRIAFERQLVFTVGRSVTTGQDNCIVWNDIHHKTEGYGNGSGYGYPDPNYLDNVLAELASHGVTDDT